MLTYLAVKNLTVIEKASLEFGAGLNVITGETGAGKSVLVGAIKFLTGERYSRLSLRDPSKKLSVEGIFTDVDRINNDLKDQYEIEDELILSRETDDAGHNKVLINGSAAPVSKLRSFSEYLIDIHGQNENQFLFNPSKHLDFVDFFTDKKLIEDYSAAYKAYKKKLDELEQLKNQIKETLSLKEMYEFQLNEILSLNINIDDDSHIDEKIDFMSNIEKIKETAVSCLNFLQDGEISASDLIGSSERALSSVSSIAPELEKASESLNSASAHINEAVSYLRKIYEKDDFSPEELDSLVSRKYKLQNLLKKYGPELSDVISYSNNISEKLNNLSISEERLLSAEKEVAELKKEAIFLAAKLNEGRKSISLSISERVCSILSELELPQSRFIVKFTDTGDIDSNGGVSAEFYISTNSGFEPGPLASIASGGEISRVMLALKEVFAESDVTGTLLFDEIDTGISGKAAKSVAEKLKRLSRRKQIIVITHLPVVAAMGDIHFHISKSEENGKSVTNIVKVDDKFRENTIAAMIAGEASESAIKQARELINNAKELN